MTRFGTNSAHVLKSNFCVFEYFFIIFYLRHQKLPPLQKTFSDWMVLSKLKIRITKKSLFVMLNPQIRPLRLLNLVNPLYSGTTKVWITIAFPRVFWNYLGGGAFFFPNVDRLRGVRTLFSNGQIRTVLWDRKYVKM